uniref:HORMA domain-containing protein n=1 Tax=Poecilia mexicana TaxID=48701 RepID=A0A3B3YS25_9TELE
MTTLTRQDLNFGQGKTVKLIKLSWFSFLKLCAPIIDWHSSDTLLSHVEQLLRAFILKISVCDAVLNNNPPGCSFTVLVHTRDAATRNMEKVQVIKDFPWIVADEQEVHMKEPRLIPLKSMTSDIVKMQLYVEERAQKT